MKIDNPVIFLNITRIYTIHVLLKELSQNEHTYVI